MLRGRDERSDDGDDGWWREQSGWAKSGTVCAIGLIATLIVCGGVIAWGVATNRTAGTSAQVPAAASRPSAAGVSAATTVVPAPVTGAASAVGSSPAPANVTWLQVGRGGLPFSSGAGPAVVRRGVPSGFAHTQSGAVIASIQILGRMSWSAQTTTSMRAVAASSTLPAAQARRSLTYGPPSDPSVIPTVAAFQVLAYSPIEAVINVALRFNGTLRVVPATMRWSPRDWKLAGAPGPLGQTNWAEIGDLTGYVLFSGQPSRVGS